MYANLIVDDERIDAFLKGEMTPDEEQQFLAELKKNPELREKAVVMARLVKGLKEVGEEQDKIIMEELHSSSEEFVQDVAKASVMKDYANLIVEDERIDAFLKGEMTSDEEEQFLAELKKNPELREKAVVMARLVKGLKEVGEEQDKIIMEELHSSSEVFVQDVARASVMKGNYVAASIIPMSHQHHYGFALNKGDNEEIEADDETTPVESQQQTSISDADVAAENNTSQLPPPIPVQVTSESDNVSHTAPNPTASKPFNLHKLALWLSVAASIVFVAWFSFNSLFMKYHSMAPPYMDIAPPYMDIEYDTKILSPEMITRGSDELTEVEKKLNKLFLRIKKMEEVKYITAPKRQYKLIISELSDCWEKATADTYNDYTDYSSEIGWNLAILYLKVDDKDNAKKVLEKLISITENGSAINMKAKVLLENI